MALDAELHVEVRAESRPVRSDPRVTSTGNVSPLAHRTGEFAAYSHRPCFRLFGVNGPMRKVDLADRDRHKHVDGLSYDLAGEITHNIFEARVTGV